MNQVSAPHPIARDPRWKSFAAKDPSADGRFFIGVKTTGIYCRPSCPARTPKPQNVAFFESAEAAERAGFRPCKRCHPDRPSLWTLRGDIVAEVCRRIESAEAIPSLDALAKKAGFSPYHFHRLFKSATGMTPAAYGRAHRASRMREALTHGESVTAAIHEAGYGSASRFYETSDKVLGMKPSDYRSGGVHTEIFYSVGESSLGRILVAHTGRGICAIFLGDEPEPLIADLKRRFPKAIISEAGPDFGATVAQVVSFVEQPGRGLDLPLDLLGTNFQKRVWAALQEIPLGQTVTYADIAARIGAPRAVRAVGTACGANHVSLAVPCHRVVGTDGRLHGYRWGLDRKKELLKRERGED